MPGRCLFAAFLALALVFAMLWMQRRLAPPPAEPAATPQMPAAAPMTVRVLREGAVEEMPLERYLVGVVAAEMPADFEPEALRAQAVAARTYTLYCAHSRRHAEADVCTDYRCCQAWKSDELADKRVREAVETTAGQYLRYEGEAAFTAFHSSSAGYTEDCAAIWGGAPYLVSVSSPENADSVPNYVSHVDVSPLDFRDTLLSVCPEADFSGTPETWIGETSRDPSGRVAQMRLGGAAFSGVKLRELFSLRSTAFALALEEGVFRFTVVGFGHGVGMSQYGANVMASQGAGYAAILRHYYPGTELVYPSL